MRFNLSFGKSFYLLLLLSFVVASGVNGFAEDTSAGASSPAGSLDTLIDQPATPTPVSEFAPEEQENAKPGTYDQGMTIADVTIEGSKLIDEQTIKNNMLMKSGTVYSKRLLQQDLRRIYDLGYFTDNIKATPVSTRQGIQLRISVEENAPVTGVSVVGNTVISAGDIQKLFASQTGLPQNVNQLNETIRQIEKLYADKGYVLARVKNIDDDPDGVINLNISEGKLADIQYIGNRKTKPFVMERNLLTKKGDVYNEKMFGDDMRRLFATGAFSDVRRVITVSPDNPDQYNLTIEVDEKRTGAISLGGGADTGTGFFGSVGYTDPNFLGRQQNVNAAFSVGSGILQRESTTQARARNYQFDVGWSSPSLFNTNNALSTNLFGRDLSSFNVPLGIERRVGADVTWSRPLDMLGPRTSGSLSLRGENIKLRDFASDRDLRRFGINNSDRKKQLTGGTFLSLSPTLAFDTRDNRFNPTNGWLNTVSLTGALGTGANSYGVASVNLRRYIKLREGITLALNAQGGKSLLGDIPEFNMFRMGGVNSVRGFSEGGLGIGSGYATATAELRTKVPFVSNIKNFPLKDTLTAAFFADAGTLFSESKFNSVFDRSGFGASIGAGLRFNIPGLGPIRIDYAVPITSAGRNSYIRRFNFGVGQKF
jgi:outer membrane protein insertion porin family